MKSIDENYGAKTSDSSLILPGIESTNLSQVESHSSISRCAGTHSVLTSQAKTKTLSLIFAGLPDHGSFPIDYGLIKIRSFSVNPV